MILEEALKAFITLAPLYPLRLPENPQYPAITYQRISAPRVQSHDGSSGLVYARYQFSCYSETFLEARQTLNSLREQLDGYKGTMGTVLVSSCLSQTDRDFYDADTRIWRSVIDFIIGYAE